MKFSTTIVVIAACLGSTTLVSAAPKFSLSRIAKNVGKGLSHAAEFANAVQHGRRDLNLEERKFNVKNLAHKLGNIGKTAVKAAGGGSAIAQHAGAMVNAYRKMAGNRRGLDEQEDLGLFLRDLEQDLVERGWDEELEILRRDFGDLLVERDFEEELDARDFEEELDARDFDEYELDARDVAEGLDARDWEIDELD